MNLIILDKSGQSSPRMIPKRESIARSLSFPTFSQHGHVPAKIRLPKVELNSMDFIEFNAKPQ